MGKPKGLKPKPGDVNRIAASVRKMEAQIKERISLMMTTKARVEATGKSLDMGLGEFARFQELKSLAVATGKLTAAEGQYVYALLGETPSVFNGQPVAVKAVLTQLFRELLEGGVQ